MRISDWSSDVCSSDLVAGILILPNRLGWIGGRAAWKLAETVGVPPEIIASSTPVWKPALTRTVVDLPPMASIPCFSTPILPRSAEIGRAHVCTPVTNAHLVCRLLLEKQNNITKKKI